MTYTLITGGAGFIGSHLADALIKRGDFVHAYDNLSTGDVANIEHLRAHDRFAFTEADVLDWDRLEECMAQADRVIHLAAEVGVKRIMERPVETIITNVRGTEYVLELAHEHDVQAIIASTSEVYGKAMEKEAGLESLSESDDWTLGSSSKRRWAYACSKAMDEFLALAYADEHGLPVVVTRFFNTVGPRQSSRYGMVIPAFVRQALEGEPLRVHGDGTQTRCFTHVQDAVSAVLGLMESDEAQGRVFNVGSPEEISIRELAQRVIENTGSSSAITYIPYEEVYGPGFEDMKRRTPDLSRIQDAIGYEPQHSLDDILQDVIAHMRTPDAVAA